MVKLDDNGKKAIRLKKIGNSHYFFVPMYYIRAGVIDINKFYEVDITEVKE